MGLAIVSLAFCASASAALTASDYDVFVDMAEVDTTFGLAAQLGITIDSDSQTTWTLLNAASSDSWSGTDGGSGTGNPPRIDQLFFSLHEFGGAGSFTANDLTMALVESLSDVDSGWSLNDANGNSGGAGTFELVNESDDSGSRLGRDLKLVFTLTTDQFVWDLDTFLNAPLSGAGNGGYQAAASFQSVGEDGDDSGVVAGLYGEGGDTPAGGVPAPGSLILFATGIAGFIGARRFSK
ncbi:PEP-CTERM sorting domain-containing protein [Sediminicurvatus halobius]|nr:PEP-CTERM sorting domain-containing protein [Spiribacter halobius]UEX78449.1 PEP-CTERM sorting domain-containing protein [Spiribacter halobius]